jgi:hypothetical protein
MGSDVRQNTVVDTLFQPKIAMIGSLAHVRALTLRFALIKLPLSGSVNEAKM